MDQGRILELEQLLQQALPATVSHRRGAEAIPLHNYRANLLATRTAYNPDLRLLMSTLEPEIPDPVIEARINELVADELQPYIYDGRILSASFVISGGATGGSSTDYIVRNLLRRAIVDGPPVAAGAFADCISDSSCNFYEYRLLTGVQVSEECEMFEGIRLIPTPDNPQNLPAHLPPVFRGLDNGPKVDDFLSKTLLRIDLQVAPVFQKPSQHYTFDSGPDSHFNITLKSTEVPDLDLNTLFQALSFGSRQSVRSVMSWRAADFYEIFDLSSMLGGGGGFSWTRPDTIEVNPKTISKAELEEAKSLYNELSDLPQQTKDALRVPIDRWTKSHIQRDPADTIIDLGIALESLYLSDSGPQSELGFRLALRASWHLGKDQAQRTSLMKDFTKIYQWRSRAVHAGNLDSKKDKVASDPAKRKAFISRAQELCSQSIREIIKQGQPPHWNSLVLGTD